MQCCEVYLGVFGAWGWERLGDDGEVIDESREVFEQYQDCVEDARQNGYCVANERRSGELLAA